MSGVLRFIWHEYRFQTAWPAACAVLAKSFGVLAIIVLSVAMQKNRSLHFRLLFRRH